MSHYPYTWFVRFNNDRYQVSTVVGLEALKHVDYSKVETICLAPTKSGWPPVIMPTNGAEFKLSVECEMNNYGEVQTVAVTIEIDGAKHWLFPTGKVATSGLSGTYESVHPNIK